MHNSMSYLRKMFFMVMVAALMGSWGFAENVGSVPDWNKGLADAVSQGYSVLLDFYTDWCPHCKRLDATTFKDQVMLDYFAKEKITLIKINPEKDKSAEEKFKVFSYPTMIVMDSKGNEVDRLLGYRSTAELIKALDDLKKGIGTLDDLLKRLNLSKEKGKSKSAEHFDLLSGIMDKYIARASYPEALNIVSEIVGLDKDNSLNRAAAALSEKGYIYYKWKKYDMAIDALLEIRKIFPKSEEASEGYLQAAYYAEKTGNGAKALSILQEFVSLFPSHKEIDKTKKRVAELSEKLGAAGK